MVSIIPAILTKSFDEVLEKFNLTEGVVERVQVDIIDGLFAKNETIDPSQLCDIETSTFIDYHLMVKEPITWIDRCVKGQADRIIGHIEMMDDQIAFVSEVRGYGKAVGLAIDLDTPVSKLDATVIGRLDVILLMSVKAGFGGQDFDEKVLEKITELDHIRARDNLFFTICIDGGITLQNIDEVATDGVDEVTIGQRIFDGEIRANIEHFKNASHGVQ
jgi:ribulose-phosphate 3-epimerase